MLKVNGVTNLRPLNLPRNIKRAFLLVLLLLPQKFLLLKALVMSSLRMSRQTLSLALLLCELKENNSKMICSILIQKCLGIIHSMQIKRGADYYLCTRWPRRWRGRRSSIRSVKRPCRTRPTDWCLLTSNGISHLQKNSTRDV